MTTNHATIAESGIAPDARPSTADEFITLAEAGQHAPGRPSTNCVWRWARSGVRSRSGEVVTLEHVRAGGKLFTTRRWLREFSERLAAADRAYFAHRMAAPRASGTPTGEPSPDSVEAALKAAGL